MSTDDRSGNNLGDGDLVDPDVHDIGDDELVDHPPSGEASVSTAAGTADGDADSGERASEIDDITAPVPRIAPEAGAPGDGPNEPGPAVDTDAVAGADPVDADLADVDVAALLAEREEYRALAQRVQADFDNYRRRAQTQAEADVDRATGRLAEALLPVLDAAEAAYLRHPEEVGPLLNQMLVELKKHGLETLDLDGRPFDPEVAEAVAHEPGAGGDPTVAEVLRSGYRWKGRTLRAAMVKTTD